MSDILRNIGLFIGLLLLQVMILNKINFLGYANPMLYMLFILVFPLKKERGLFLVLSFILGLFVDFFLDSGGINASASLLIAYIRLPVLKGLLNKTDVDFAVFKITKLPFLKLLSFIAIMVFVHHLAIFSLEYFSFKAILTILSRTILTSFFTIILIIFSLLLMTNQK
ncbi:rod shape-determining protein MreD [Flavobacteriaceae bacterium F08102]|nr:rod shape-determining protein MreD [Flavobacteriaceae bacterium F08102]